MTAMSLRVALALLGSAAVVCSTVGCAGSESRPGRSGGSPPLKLTLANGDADVGAAVQRFVDRVAHVSKGQLEVEVRSSWGNGASGYERRVLGDVRRGKADLAWLGTRVFDTAGVTSFQALEAPLLIDSYPLEKAVLSSPLPTRMLPGLRKIGLVGLAVLGDKLREPFGTTHFFARPSDYSRVTFGTYDSQVEEEAVRDLGARPSEVGWAGLRDALARGELDGMETALAIYNGKNYVKVAPFVTANVRLWPQTDAIVANGATLAKLSPEQRAWLKRAARDAAAYSLTLLHDDASELAASCRAGAHVIVARAADLAALRQAWAPLYARLAQTNETATFLREIEALKRSVPPESHGLPPDCGGARTANPPSTQRRSANVLDGVYRVSWSQPELVAAGTTNLYANNNYGLITLTLRSGKLRMHWQGFPAAADCLGSSSVSGQTLTLALSPPSCEGVTHARWVLQDHQLRLYVTTVSDPGDRALYGGKPWTKIA
jgi:TRAP-type C4-dicarboxylate transport system substrate-binding protein